MLSINHPDFAKLGPVSSDQTDQATVSVSKKRKCSPKKAAAAVKSYLAQADAAAAAKNAKKKKKKGLCFYQLSKKAIVRYALENW